MAFCLLCVPPGQGGLNASIEFPLGQVISAQDAVAVNILHADQKFLPCLYDVGKGVETLITSVCDKDRGRSVISVAHGIKSGSFVQLFLPLKHDIAADVV